MSKTGAGGYGGISTQNQDQRGPRYGKHTLISTVQNMLNATVLVTCLKCGEVWEHPRNARSYPLGACISLADRREAVNGE